MKTTPQTLPKVGECIEYVKSLGYTYMSYKHGFYYFKIIDKTTRPKHNWVMSWTLGEMRHAVKYGC